jgi:hypothetical protein
LACTAAGGQLLHTPKLSAAQNIQIRNASLNIHPDGNISGKMHTLFSGAQYDNHEVIMGKPATEQQKMLKQSYNIDNIDFNSINYAQQKDINPKLIEDIEINIRNYAPINGSKMFLQLNAFNTRRSIPEIKNRILPVYINRGYTDEDILTYTLPDNVITELIQEQHKNLKSDFGEYICHAKVDGKKLIYYRKFVLNDGTFPAEKYDDFAKFINEVASYDYLKLALSLKK